MTVASQIKQTLAALKGAAATIEKYGSYHPDESVKTEFRRADRQLSRMIDDLEKRLSQVEFEEPQFKGF